MKKYFKFQHSSKIEEEIMIPKKKIEGKRVERTQQ